MPLRGVVPPLVTPLVDDELDKKGLDRLLGRQLASGVRGLFILGTTGEGPSLRYRVRRALVDAVTNTVAGRKPVLVGITDTSLSESIDAARCAEAAGADAVVYAPPCYFPTSQQSLADAVRQLADQSPLPVLLYNMPALTKTVYEIDTVAKLLDEPNVVGLKDSSGDLEYFRQLLALRKDRPAWTLMTGPEHLMAPSVQMGGDGGVCGGANICPELFAELFDAAANGDSPQVARLQAKVELLGALYNQSSDRGVAVIQGVKAALAALRLCTPELCSPYRSLPSDCEQAVAEVLRELGLLNPNDLAQRASNPSGFTLVELLTVIAIVGVLVALLIPAVQAAREATRRAECKNHLKQISLAMLVHESAHGHLPTGGWGFRMVGDAGSGYGRKQPGGWAYNILEYIEQGPRRDLGGPILKELKRLRPVLEEQFVEMNELVTTPIPMWMCPSRRPAIAYPFVNQSIPFLAFNAPECRSGIPRAPTCYVARGDYRANAGNVNRREEPGSVFMRSWFSDGARQTGVVYQCSRVSFQMITDGASKTALIGEKSLNPADYGTGLHSSDDQCVYTGHDQDNQGYTANGADRMPPVQDGTTTKDRTRWRFGGPHTYGMHMALCDGAVETISYNVDQDTFALLGGRNDQVDAP
ncbi:4-hydroxy-tetrahydrodipicolinate synthase (HTPA synthase) [Durusdinium trenchii]|uniref:4-hydroxy-tetrahydrodipicolinate synthase (HTPA synthase) n=1 Tax=Durusdinium trenchii TaxID=1381693 RepID=A0ABP0LE73_9DINO